MPCNHHPAMHRGQDSSRRAEKAGEGTVRKYRIGTWKNVGKGREQTHNPSRTRGCTKLSTGWFVEEAEHSSAHCHQIHICAKALFQNTGSHDSRKHKHCPITIHVFKAQTNPRSHPAALTHSPTSTCPHPMAHRASHLLLLLTTISHTALTASLLHCLQIH